jgi:hypothetical protein
MMSVNPVTSTPVVGTGNAATGISEALTAGIPAGCVSDPAAMALFSSMGMSDGQLGLAKNKVAHAEIKRAKEIEKARKAILEARKQEKEGGFWNKVVSVAKTVGLIAGAAGGVAAAGATGGSSLVVTAAIVGAALSAGSVAMKALDADVNYEFAGLKLTLSDTMALSGMALSTGAGLGASGTAVGWAARSAHYGGIACRGVQTGARGTEAVATERRGHHEANALEFRADAEDHRIGAEHQANAVREAIDSMRSASDAKQRALRAVASILEEREAAMRAVTGRRA